MGHAVDHAECGRIATGIRIWDVITELLREEEATRKWCPFSRAVYLGGAVQDELGGAPLLTPHNRVGGHEDGIDAVDYCRCVASDCMAWRWAEVLTTDKAMVGFCGLIGGYSKGRS